LGTALSQGWTGAKDTDASIGVSFSLMQEAGSVPRSLRAKRIAAASEMNLPSIHPPLAWTSQWPALSCPTKIVSGSVSI
jgi:hypothetical protein